MTTPPACLSPPIWADLSSSWFANSKQVPTGLTTALSECKEAWIIITQPATEITWNPLVWRCQYVHAPQWDSQVCWIVLVSGTVRHMTVRLQMNGRLFVDVLDYAWARMPSPKLNLSSFGFYHYFTICYWSHKGGLTHTTWRSWAYIKWSATSALEKIQLTCRNTRYVRFIFFLYTILQ